MKSYCLLLITYEQVTKVCPNLTLYGYILQVPEIQALHLNRIVKADGETMELGDEGND